MKKSTVLILVALAAGVIIWQRTRTSNDIDSGYLRELAEKVTTECAAYYAALPEFALSGGGATAQKNLETSMENVYLAILDMNLAVIFNDDRNLYPGAGDVANFIARPENYTEEQRLDFLKVTLKQECRKWQSFAQLSDGEIQVYFEKQENSLVDGIQTLCDAIKAEASKMPTQVEIQVKQCEVQQGDNGEVFVVGLNDWLEWIDFSDDTNMPDSEDLNNYIFDFPLQLILNGFRLANTSPEEFEAIFIAFRDVEQTVYELRSEDVDAALSDKRELGTVLLELREKIKISSLK